MHRREVVPVSRGWRQRGLPASCRFGPFPRRPRRPLRASSPCTRNFRYSLRCIRPSSHTTIDPTVSRPWNVRDIRSTPRGPAPAAIRARAGVPRGPPRGCAHPRCSARRRASAALREARSSSARRSPRFGIRIFTRWPARSDSHASMASRSSTSTGTCTAGGNVARRVELLHRRRHQRTLVSLQRDIHSLPPPTRPARTTRPRRTWNT